MPTTALPARPFCWWSAAALARVATPVRQACSDWAVNWGLALSDLQAFNACESGARAVDWQSLAGATLLAGGEAGTSACGIALALFGPSPSRPGEASGRNTGLAAEVGAKAWEALAASLRVALASTEPASSALPTSPHAGDLKPWSAAVQLRASFSSPQGAETTVWLHLDPSLARQLGDIPRKATPAPQRPPLVPVAQAVAHRRLGFVVEIAPAELTLGELQTLRVGDVLTLPHALDTPLAVRSLSAAGSPPAPAAMHAYLGTRDGHRAIELLRTDHAG